MLIDLEVICQYDFELLGADMTGSVHNLTLVGINILWLLTKSVSVFPVDLWDDVLLLLAELNVVKESDLPLLWLSFGLLLLD